MTSASPDERFSTMSNATEAPREWFGGELWIAETAYAGPETPCHVRYLSETGPKLGGGADTVALCGREVAWDVMRYHGSDQHIFRVCVHCALKADR